jgi:hypothetical protein
MCLAQRHGLDSLGPDHQIEQAVADVGGGRHRRFGPNYLGGRDDPRRTMNRRDGAGETGETDWKGEKGDLCSMREKASPYLSVPRPPSGWTIQKGSERHCSFGVVGGPPSAPLPPRRAGNARDEDARPQCSTAALVRGRATSWIRPPLNVESPHHRNDPLVLLACSFRCPNLFATAPKGRDDQAGGNQQACGELTLANGRGVPVPVLLVPVSGIRLIHRVGHPVEAAESDACPAIHAPRSCSANCGCSSLAFW